MAKAKPLISLNRKPYIVSFLSDYGFKVTFGDKDSTLFARKSIELILGETHPIQSLKYLRNEFDGISKDARTGIYDVLCQDEYKRIFIIEMQVDNYENLLERLQFYAFHVYNTKAMKGNNGFSNMGIVHCICILKGAITDSTNYHQVIALKNQENDVVMNNLVFHLIELGKFPIAQNALSSITTEKEELFYTMKYAHKFDPFKNQLPDFWDKDFFKIALQRLDTSKMDPLEVAAYENNLMRIRTVAQHNDKKIKEAVQEAVQIALEQAAKEKAKELEQAAKEKAKELEQAAKTAETAKIEAIKKGLLMNILTVEQLAEIQGVSVSFVKEVQQSLNTPEKPIIKKRTKKSTKS
jgi:predicted transposase/invertase (TIGR01784 family)